jgi:hypothetical protein
MARYSPELLAAIRYRYEDTDQPMTGLAADFDIGITTLQTLVRKNGWTPRSQRLRDCPSAVRLLEDAQGLAATPSEQDRDPQQSAGPTLPVSGSGSDAAPPAMPAPAPAASTLSPAERIEALVVKELEAEEAARAELALRPRARHEAERCARTLSVLTQTLQTVKKLHAGGGAGGQNYDEAPKDMEAFREEVALKLRALIDSRRGSVRVLLNRQLEALSDDELRELIQLGRERGVQALLQPPAEQESKQEREQESER